MQSLAKVRILLFTLCFASVAYADIDFKLLSRANSNIFKTVNNTGNKFSIVGDNILKNKKISVLLPPRVAKNATNEEYLASSLVYTLQQFKVPSNKLVQLAQRGAPIIESAVQDIINKRSVKLASFFDWAKDIATGAACVVFAATGLPWYLSAASIFAAQNTGMGTPTTPEQDFFIYPVHGSISHDEDVKIYYKATRAAGFGSAEGATFNRNIYITTESAATKESPTFKSVTRLLIHEFTHVTQYRDVSWNLAAFGTKYLFFICKDGGYEKSRLERDAYEKQKFMDQLFEPPGYYFFKIWSDKRLAPTLGLPKARNYIERFEHVGKLLELPFQYGTMQVNYTNKEVCFRTFSTKEISIRSASACRIQTKCMPPRSTGKPIENGPKECDPEEVQESNAKCKDAKQKWNAINSGKIFRECITSMPSLPLPPARCPATCKIVTIIPRTSKSCLQEDPPPGCDADAKKNNDECKKEKIRCGV